MENRKMRKSYTTLESVTPKAIKLQANDPARKGEYASNHVFWGNDSRYCMRAVHTRFNKVSYMIFDAEGKFDGPGLLECVDIQLDLEYAVETLKRFVDNDCDELDDGDWYK